MNELGASYAILSGRHGVVSPDEVLEPYDLNLSDLSHVAQSAWAHVAFSRLRESARGRRITILAACEYTRPITDLNRTHGAPLEIDAPWESLTQPDLPIWLAQAHSMARRLRDLKALYQWIEGTRASGQVFSFRSLAEQHLPKQGVYIFLDPREPNFTGAGPRIVRIGTHAVSRGSKASLRGRLRNHLGPATEVGNHRGSIFRLHVGRALLESSGGHHLLATWGDGQDAALDVKAAEAQHEIMVSRYLQELEVALIAILDEPNKDSLRAIVEAQLIALCTEDMQPIDRPTSDWLGRHSPVAQIKESGLWNIRGVGGSYDPTGAGSVGSIVKA